MADASFRIGNEVGHVGRWYRLLLGGFFLAYSVLGPTVLNPMPRAALPTFVGKVGLALAVIVLLYLVVFGLIGEWVLARVTPWVGTLIFLGTPAVLMIAGLLPGPVMFAWGLYISASLIMTFFIRYGGCEVVALPSILFGRRYTMYCPLNGIDAVERAVSLDLSEHRDRIATFLSLAIVVLVGGSFLLAESIGIPAMLGIEIDIDNRWALLLLVPIAKLARDAWQAWRSRGVRRFWSYALGAGVLVLALSVFLVDGLTDMLVWRGVMVLGAMIAVRQLALRAARRLREGRVGGAASSFEERKRDAAVAQGPK